EYLREQPMAHLPGLLSKFLVNPRDTVRLTAGLQRQVDNLRARFAHLLPVRQFRTKTKCHSLLPFFWYLKNYEEGRHYQRVQELRQEAEAYLKADKGKQQMFQPDAFSTFCYVPMASWQAR